MTDLLYLDPWSGVAGDMLLGALLDLGAIEGGADLLRSVVAGLGFPPRILSVRQVTERGLRATQVDVEIAEGQPPRGPRELTQLILDAPLSETVRVRAVAAIRRLAEAEAAVHGLPVEQVHFHELGAVDTLVDVVGAFALWEALGSPKVASAPLPLGSGFVDTAHGRLAVPAPATLALCVGVPVTGGDDVSELTTPTGALLATELAQAWGALPPMRPRAVGYGAGHRSLASGPNLLRVTLGQMSEPVGAAGAGAWEAGDALLLLETAVDDMSGEELGHLQEALPAAGAVDVWLRPVQMKKNRPGVEVAVLVPAEAEEEVLTLLFRESSTFGVRRRWVERHCLEREWIQVAVGGVDVAVKVGRWRGEVTALSPEYETAVAAARALQRPLGDVMAEARVLARARLDTAPL